MPVNRPLDYWGLWAEVEPYTGWPVSDENAVEELGVAWRNAGAAFRAGSGPALGDLATTWTDPVGQEFQASVGELRQDAEKAADDMTFVAEITAAYAYDVYWAKNEIVRAIDLNGPAYGQLAFWAPELAEAFVQDTAAIINDFLRLLAGEIAARGAGGDPPTRQPTIDHMPGVSMPPTPDERNVKGADREKEVAELVGGTVVGAPGGKGLKVYDPWTGEERTDVDVIGPDGTFIAVGGGAKAHDLDALTGKLTFMKLAADEQGVRAEAWFTSDTPPEAIERANLALGKENVFLFM